MQSISHPYEKHENQYGVRLSYLVSDESKKNEESLEVMNYESYKKKCYRNPAFRLKEGRGKGNEALVRWSAIDEEWQRALISLWGHPDKHLSKGIWRDYYKRDPKAAEFYSAYRLPDGRSLPDDVQAEYTTNASILNTVIYTMTIRKEYRKKAGGTTAPVWEIVVNDVEGFQEESGHTLKTASLRRILREYKKGGYQSIISGKWCNTSAKKVKSEKQQITIEELIKKHQNLDNTQIATLYNSIAAHLNWKSVTPATIANYRKETDIYTYSGRRGETKFRNTISMQVRRKAPSAALQYWTLDGWDVELMYQKDERNKNDHKVTTYHNRPTAVIVLDPCVKYPIGFAIGTHETQDLIREAVKNAINHTKELFGERYKPLELQSDHYGKGTLTPFYEAVTKYYTPARVKNAKAKVIEPYFKHLNKKIQGFLLPNWSGFGATSRRELQPNDEFLTKIKNQFPDYNGVKEQIEKLITHERIEKIEAYRASFDNMPAADRMIMTDEDYLNLFGITTGFTNRLEGPGLLPTILGEKLAYDCYDRKFRELRHIDWMVKYDPEDLSTILAVNAEKKNGEIREIGTYRFILERKHEQPMALYERQEGDAQELTKIRDFNSDMESDIIQRSQKNREVLEEMFMEHPELDTLHKMILPDSRGQHKDQRNAARIERKKTFELPQPKDEDFEVIIDPVEAARSQY